MGEFSDKVFAVVRRIPRGTVASYGQVARLVGAPRSARYVGYALHANPDPGAEVNHIPCHRVVFKDGGLCRGYAFGGPDIQREMLEAEGVTFADNEHVDMESCQWDGHDATGPDTDNLPTTPPPDFDWQRELGEV
ncbi:MULTISPECIES: MGMT family protein [Gordonibacter]|uniref:MGMT family protein n=1 Tax=Gordonibacter faecis TaxID=3047475 RepID=A0ABT7DQR2_9ACTN|nr:MULTISPECIES: MGMT family protein [unclassified Gordonibacter]MDJ1651868.1 MGMT family protein [Gordonibacter sp. KGMB12511]HIW75295.1 MGMT family protein [Candidatus Gordonibacter avicola]